jgi:hypothetical protein
MGRHCQPLLTVVGSSRGVAESLIEMLDMAEIPGSGFADAAMAARLSAVTLPADSSTGVPRRKFWPLLNSKMLPLPT